jgi:hypothetical protein
MVSLAPQDANQRRVLTFFKIEQIIAATVLFFTLGAIAASFVHEVSHALVGWAFGLQIYSIQLSKVVLEHSSNVLVHTLVWGAGGFGQALFALVLFLCGLYLFKRVTVNKEQLRPDNSRLTQIEQIKHFYKRLLPGIIFGFELVFLSIAIHGAISVLLEGFFNTVYVAAKSYDAIVVLVFAFCLTLSFVFLYSYQKRQLRV